MRSAIPVILIPILGWVLVFGQETTPQHNPSVSGIVVASDTGQPLSKARVAMVRQRGSPQEPGPSTTTATDGTFSLTDVPPGAYALIAQKNGYVALRGKSNITLNVTPGSNISGLRLQLNLPAVITGKVLNEDEEPVAYVNVDALRRFYGPQGPSLRPVGNAQTNDLGEYRIFGLTPGRYILRAVPRERWMLPSFAGKDPDADTTYPPLYYPNTTLADEAVAYDLRAGAEARADFHLVRVAGVTVRGRVTGVTAEQASRVTLMLRAGRQQVVGIHAKEDGTFQTRGVAPGVYMLDAWCSEPNTGGAEPRMLAAQRKLVLTPGGSDEVVLNLQPLATGEIRGQIRVEGSVPDLKQIYVVLAPMGLDEEDWTPISIRPASASVLADGTFRMQLRGRGKYRATLSARGSGLEDYYTKAVLYGGRDVMDSGFTFTGGSPSLEIVVSSAGARIEGSAVDEQGKPVAGATVVTVPEKSLRDRYDLYQPARTDQTGHFVIRGQRPGNYTVFAFDEITDAVYMDPSFIKDHEDKGQALRAEGNGRHQLALKVIHVNPEE